MGIDLLNSSRVAVISNVISEEDCKTLHEYAVYIKSNNIDIDNIATQDTKAESDDNIEYWRQKNLYFKFTPKKYKDIAKKLHLQYKKLFKEYLEALGIPNASYNTLELEPMVVHIYQKGDSLDPHQDGRDFALVFYLSSPPEFTGGELVYADLGIKLEPVRGTLVIAPSNETHEVLPVISGYRCAITNFISVN